MHSLVHALICVRFSINPLTINHRQIYYVSTIFILNPCMYHMTPTASTCNHGDLRLYGGRSRSDGIAEVCINGLWANICYSYLNWGATDSNVFCRQLLGRDNVGRCIMHFMITNSYYQLCKQSEPIMM